MIKNLFFVSVFISTTQLAMTQTDSLQSAILDEVIVYATRANEKTPTTFTNISKKDLKDRNLGQDLPVLLNFTPSLISTSDAGAGIGYTYMRIRGSDASRINVTINNIPLNDPESHGVFWVNLPDFSSSINSVQIQRGVGSSSNGGGAFGATVNLETNNFSQDLFVERNFSAGSFNTFKANVIFNTGIINKQFNFEARLSRIISDGYIDRSGSNLRSYYLSGGSYGKKTIIKTVFFGGSEITHQAWYGTPAARVTGNTDALNKVIDFSGEYVTQDQKNNLLNSDRRFNYYLYDNEVDDYKQDHYQLHLTHTFSSKLNFSGALHYTYGRGFFEQYNGDDLFSNYGLQNIIINDDTTSSADIIVRRWLDNHFYGITYGINYDSDKLELTLGGGINRYNGYHFGEIIWSSFAGNTNIRDKYYKGDAIKTDFNIFLKSIYQITHKLSAYGDVQLRNVNYQTEGKTHKLTSYDINKLLSFFNPKAGFTYQLSNNTQLYASYGIGNREPVRSDYIFANDKDQLKHETLRNVEVGIKSRKQKFSYELNYYLMNYKNQLVHTGAINDVGENIRTNTIKSHRMGVEIVGNYIFSKYFNWSLNVTLSQNKIKEFIEPVVATSFDEIKHKNTDISFSPNIISGSRLSFNPTKKLSIELLSKYVGKQFLDNTSNEDRAIDSYLTHDLRLAYQFSIGGIDNIGFTLLINNLTNERYSSNGYTWGYYYGNNDELYQQNNYYPQATINFLSGLSIKL